MPKTWSETTPYTTDFYDTDIQLKSTFVDPNYISQAYTLDSFKTYLSTTLNNRFDASGVFTGGDISQNATAPSLYFDVTAGTGQIIDPVTNEITYLSWPAFIGVVPAYFTEPDKWSFVLIKESTTPGIGELLQSDAPQDSYDRRQYIALGVITHPFGLGIQAATNTGRNKIFQLGQYIFDNVSEPFLFMTKQFECNYAFNPIGGAPLGNLQLSLIPLNSDIGAQMRMRGVGDDDDPNHIDVPTVPAFPQFFTAWRDSNNIPKVGVSFTGAIDPTVYNPLGTDALQPVPDDQPWTIFRIYTLAAIPVIAVLWGRETHTTQRAALQNYKNEQFNLAPLNESYMTNAIFTSYLIVSKNSTDLSDPLQATFIPAVEEFGASAIDHLNSGLISGGIVTDEGLLDIAWTAGAVYDIIEGVPYRFDAGSTTLTNNAIVYVFWKQSTKAIVAELNTPTDIDVCLAIVCTAVGEIINLSKEVVLTKRLRQRLDIVCVQEPYSVISGLSIDPDPDPTSQLDVTLSTGEYISRGIIRILVPTVNSRDTISPGVYKMSRYFHSAGAWAYDTSPNIDTTYYDNGTTKTTIPLNNWAVCIFAHKYDPQNDIHQIAYFYPDQVFANETNATNFANAIQAGTEPIPNEPPAFALLPKFFAYVFKQGETALILKPSTRWVDLRVSRGVSAAGDGFIPAEFEHAYFVRFNGNNGRTGLNWDEAFADFQTANTAINAQTPTETNQFSVRCNDSGSYTGTMTVPPFTHIDAPDITFNGAITLSQGSSINIHRLLINSNITGLQGAIFDATSVQPKAAYGYIKKIELADFTTTTATPIGIKVPSTTSPNIPVTLICHVTEFRNDFAQTSPTTATCISYQNTNDDLLVINGNKMSSTQTQNNILFHNNNTGNFSANFNEILAANNNYTTVYPITKIENNGSILLTCDKMQGTLLSNPSTGNGTAFATVNQLFDGAIALTGNGKIDISSRQYNVGTLSVAPNPSNARLNFEYELVHDIVRTYDSGTTIATLDGNVLTITEGTEFYSVTITPYVLFRPIKVQWKGFYGTNTANRWIVHGLFLNTITNSVAGDYFFCNNATATAHLLLEYEYIPADYSSITFSVRAGLYATGTTEFNRSSSTQNLANTEQSVMKIVQYGNLQPYTGL
ncbi:MAG: hypothetical protein ACFFDN_00900 [Candidatus Hodarchaeota archaeon]